MTPHIRHRNKLCRRQSAPFHTQDVDWLCAQLAPVRTEAIFWYQLMKVTTFTRTHAATVDKQVSDWLATSKSRATA